MENKELLIRALLRVKGEAVKIHNLRFITKNIFSLNENENWIQ